MISSDIKESSKGLPSCTICHGTGSHIFQGCRIFCESCHGQAKISGIWKAVEAYIRKQAGDGNITPHKNERKWGKERR